MKIKFSTGKNWQKLELDGEVVSYGNVLYPIDYLMLMKQLIPDLEILIEETGGGV